MKVSELLAKLNKRPLLWMIWHPHQGFWNWDLVVAISKVFPFKKVNKYIIELIIFIDTIVLYIRALGRRASRLGITKLLNKITLSEAFPILYFDLGTHRKAGELFLMVNKILPYICEKFKAYGFEAIQEYYKEAKERFVGKENIEIIQACLCYKVPDNGYIKVYKNESGSSVYRSNKDNYENVKAMRLSDYVSRNNLDFEKNIVILRMNIEGAEFDVISDLVENGLAKNIDGYFGMWDDISKIDKHRDDEFRFFLTKNHISSFTFNGRDFWSRLSTPLRLKCIEYELNTSIQAGLRRIKQHTKT